MTSTSKHYYQTQRVTYNGEPAEITEVWLTAVIIRYLDKSTKKYEVLVKKDDEKLVIVPEIT